MVRPGSFTGVCVLALALGALAQLSVPGLVAQPESLPAQGAWQAGQGCEDCHPAIVESYRASPMARALELLQEGEAQELEELSGSGISAGLAKLEYAYLSTGQRAHFTERSNDAGADVDIGRAEVAFAIGAGSMDRSYALLRSGALCFAPLERLSGKSTGGDPALALAPGHSVAPNLRLDSPITDECLACHTSALPAARVPQNAAPSPEWIVSGIDCSTCHGDVQGHATWRAQQLAGDAPTGQDPILNPSKFEPRARLSACGRCHLQGDARLSLERGRRGHAQLGTDMFSSTAVFGAGEPTDDIGFVSHFERLLESKCFLGVPLGRLACESCHDPHAALDSPGQREQARAGCLGCHPAGAGESKSSVAMLGAGCGRDTALDAKGVDCVTCHMRKTPVFDVAAVQIHDHAIRARPPAPSKFDSIRIHQAQSARLGRFSWPGVQAPLALDEGLGMVALAAAGQRAAARELVDAQVDGAVQRLNVYQHVRGSLLEELGRLEDARVAYERSLVLDPDWSESAVNLAGVLLRQNRPEKARQRLDTLLARWPLVEGAWRNRSLARLALGDPAGARSDLERAFELAPRAVTAKALEQLASEAGDAAARELWAQRARRLDVK